MHNRITPLREYYWKGIDPQGLLVKGKILALNKAQVENELNQQTILPIKIFRNYLSRPILISPQIMIDIHRELAALIKAGIPLASALKMMATSYQQVAIEALLINLYKLISNGKLLSEAMQVYSYYFPALTRHLLAAGEQTGKLSESLNLIANYQEKLLQLRQKIKKALFYPLFVLAVAIIICGIMMIFVIPQFAKLFADFGAQLPTLTRWVIKFTVILQQSFVWIFVSAIIFYIAMKWLWQHYPIFKKIHDLCTIKIPFIHNILQKIIFARSLSTLASALSAGLTLPDALRATANMANHSYYTQSFMSICKQISGGSSLQSALRAEVLFPPRLVQMLAMGEEAGMIPDMAEKLANYYAEQLEYYSQLLTQLLEPAIMILLCGIIGIIVAAMYLPIFRIGKIL